MTKELTYRNLSKGKQFGAFKMGRSMNFGVMVFWGGARAVTGDSN